ncbi:MAG: hypothetical protein HRT67_04555 [Flavobacteriaceae bacterium]|nr:hypothetical protein [Flavobacteriaceae bacterium]
MSKQYCKVGKVKPNLNKILSLQELETKIANFVDDINAIEYLKEIKRNFSL